VADTKAYQALVARSLPTQADYDYVQSCMVPVYDIGKVANWIAPHPKGVGGKEVDFEYVKMH